MLPDYSRYYGYVFSQVIDRYERPVSIQKLDVGLQGFYLINGKLPIFIKFCRNRKSPWSFTFQHDHQTQYKKIIEEYGQCLMVLVCGTDGIAALNHQQLSEVLDGNFEEQESLSVRRKLNHMYSVAGTNGKLAGKVAKDSLLTQLNDVLEGRSGAEHELCREGDDVLGSHATT
jgi:hypothetical protein